MLKKLAIKNIALAENVELEFCGGMNCLTGETGAGKSIIVDSISALIGLRVKKDIVRSGCDSGSVKGEFADISTETAEAVAEVCGTAPINGRLVIEREISAGGRHLCRVDGKTVSSANLRKIGETLIDIYGQSESRFLSDPGVQLSMLDAYAGEKVEAEKAFYKKNLLEYTKLKSDLKALSGSPSERARMTDLLNYQIREIDFAQLSPDEEEYLTSRMSILSHCEKIREWLADAMACMGSEDSDDGIIQLMERLRGDAARAAEVSDAFEGLREASEGVYFEIRELSSELSKASEKAEYDPQEADMVNRRLDYLDKLKNKYGAGYEEIMRFRNEAEEKLRFLADSEQNASLISKRLKELEGILLDSAGRLSDLRRRSAAEFSKEIESELGDLEMNGTEFETDLEFFYEPADNGFADFGPEGLDKIEFLISPNPGQPLKPLARIASGGELSRIMLAIKNVHTKGDSISTLIFDEIDTGISGIAANRIASKLKSVSRDRQVICVTHHAQLAAAADEHIFVSKAVKNGNTATSAAALSGARRVDEIARLLDGDDRSEISRTHAEELLRKASVA
jgi:DNA repair protein RecN (Recombination protein N)